MKINKLLTIVMILSMAFPAAAGSLKKPVKAKKPRKPAAVKTVAPPAPQKSAEADPTQSWQAYSFP